MRKPQTIIDRANVSTITQQIHDEALDEQGMPETFVAGWAVEIMPKLCGSVHCDRPHKGLIVAGLRDSGHVTLTVYDDDYDKDAMVRISPRELEELIADLSEARRLIHDRPHSVPTLRPNAHKRGE